MFSFASNSIISKAKSIYGKSIKPSDYESLLKMKSVPEVAQYLSNHVNYRDTLQDVQVDSIHRARLEELIKKNIFNHTIRLIKFIRVRDYKFYEINLLKRELDILLEIVRSIISDDYDNQIAETPNYMKKHATFDIFEASKSTSMSELLDIVKDTDYLKILSKYSNVSNKDIDYVSIERDLEIYYFDEIFRRIDQNYKGKLKKDLDNIYLTKIELGNITKIYRLKKFYNADFSMIKTALIHKYSRISEKKIDELISLPNPDLILNYLRDSEYNNYIDKSEYVYVEYYSDRIKYNLAKRFMYFSSSVPKVYAAFLLLCDIEVQNLINIIEGIRYQLSEAEIRKMLIY
ncbi:MAG: hypothetical protein CVV56_03340 [Tenericutes bacterium HGW-Tenericutes-1]|jgi:V/A-type H+-transporting ATPase subunit C|nr:MAG: hypothetical protein CVV56_03340 [Tenericutes bacterium HGW-Tenericutes-1]